MQIKFKKTRKHAIIPTKAYESDAGFDLTACDWDINTAKGHYTYYTGIALEIPHGYVGLIFPRSSICSTSLILTNSVGVIDAGYRGEIELRFTESNSNQRSCNRVYNCGERIAQLVIVALPSIELIESETLSASERETKGFGSSGK